MQQPMTGELELELTFLARDLPEELKGVTPIRIEDTYIPENPAVHAQLRIRRKGDAREITKKIPVNPDDPSVQHEYTIALDDEEYQTLMAVSTRQVLKDRYFVEIDGYPAEVDVFMGRLAGLVLIDFEFKTAEEKAAFKAPACCLADVTDLKVIAGGIISTKSYGDIATQLEERGYRPLVPQS